MKKYDLSDLTAALCPRKVLIINPLASDGSPAEESKKSCYLSYPKIVYTQKDVKDHFKQLTVDDNILVNEKIIKWLD